MKESLLDVASVLEGYDSVSSLYPFVPSLSHWRAWERAAYRRFRLAGRVLDLGCGDGRYFRLLWPDVADPVGVDADAGTADTARRSGVYSCVHHADAHQLPLEDESLDAIFANCSLEHMDHLDAVLAQAFRCLVPGGILLCSVVTERFVSWSVLPSLVREEAGNEAGAKSLAQFLDFHHLANPLTVAQWCARFESARLRVQEHVPIVPAYNSRLFLLLDGLWHLKRREGGELGDDLYRTLSSNSRFPAAFRLVLEGVLRMETDWRDCSGAVFYARKAS